MSATLPTFSNIYRPFLRYILPCFVRRIGRVGSMMAGLQRSALTFRRSGSSGLVWDERFLTEAAAGRQQPELRHSRSVAMLRRGGAADGDDKKRKLLALSKPNHKDHHRKQEELLVPGTGTPFRTRDVAPAAEPPSPRVPAGCCAPCAIFRDAGAGGSSSLPRRAKNKKR
ncbi:MAPK kinase substrate protein At1g80180-like [Miscanthus floridulus]|uniref:MAPK kinase substrate protein At1g80180-like n=1 Tax=Miscanthus floridulus TaxID=154761 RepID=UPI0034578B30